MLSLKFRYPERLPSVQARTWKGKRDKVGGGREGRERGRKKSTDITMKKISPEISLVTVLKADFI